MSDETHESTGQESFFLTVLPFAGLGLLLVLAVVWRLSPQQEQSAENPGGIDPIELAVKRWEQAPIRNIEIDTSRDFTLGPPDARVTLIEFSDFECPYCRTAANGVHDILKKYEGDVRLVFKNYPLDTACNDALEQPMHRLACEAARVARCAGEQQEELFWEVHDALFREPQLTKNALTRITEELDVNVDMLNACASGEESLRAVREDIALAQELRVTGTPVFFANGRKVSDYRKDPLDAVVGHILSLEE